MKKELQRYVPICEAIAKLFHPNVEVVMHDLHSRSLAYISNAFSKRRVGDKMISDLDDISNIKEDFVGPYEKHNDDGKRLKAVTVVLREENLPVGMICINYDIENISSAIDVLQSLVQKEDMKPNRPATLFSQNWKEHTNQTIDKFLHHKGVSLAALKMQEKKELVYFLHNEGIFDIRNALSYVCSIINISRATAYNWLKKLN